MLSLFADKNTIFNAVQKIREKLNISLEDYPIDIFKVVEDYPYLSILKTDLTSQALKGALLRNPKPNPSYIILNTNQDYFSQRFTVAHEIIHYFCHPEHCLNKTLANIPTKEEREQQANIGAIELLAPRAIFDMDLLWAKQFYATDQIALEETAKYYQISLDHIKEI